MVKVLEARYVPNPVAKKMLESLEGLREENPVVARTYEYVSRFSKCGAEEAEEAYARLVEAGFTGFAAAMLINILPSTLEEAIAILGTVDGGYDEEVVRRGLEILQELCRPAEGSEGS